MSQDSETIHVSETTVASHQLVVAGFPNEGSRGGAAGVAFGNEPADDSVAMGSSGTVPSAIEVFASADEPPPKPPDPPVITEKNRVAQLFELRSSQSEAAAAEVIHSVDGARLRSQRG